MSVWCVWFSWANCAKRREEQSVPWHVQGLAWIALRATGESIRQAGKSINKGVRVGYLSLALIRWHANRGLEFTSSWGSSTKWGTGSWRCAYIYMNAFSRHLINQSMWHNVGMEVYSLTVVTVIHYNSLLKMIRHLEIQKMCKKGYFLQ